jgi:uncharacterized protein (TIGR03790 family)
MAKTRFVSRHLWGLVAALVCVNLWAGPSVASGPRAEAARWIPVPKISSRLTASDIGLVINTADPYSVEVGEYYIEQRHLKPAQVLRLTLPHRPSLSVDEFDRLKSQLDERFGPQVQALALAWTEPYAVQCHSITGALALGFDPELCRRSCGRSKSSPYFNSASAKPFSELGVRLSMLLAASNVEQAKALIDRGVAADRSLGLRGAPPVAAYFVSTQDAARNVRAKLFPPPGLIQRFGVDVKVEEMAAPQERQRVLVYETGLATVPHLDTIGWVNGALADHLTSFGGVLDKSNGQMSVLAWIDSGATASYGTVSEPCNHVQKFPQPQVLLQHYLQGSTAIEAYWRSVGWPQQGLFVGEPLAAPFSRR